MPKIKQRLARTSLANRAVQRRGPNPRTQTNVSNFQDFPLHYNPKPLSPSKKGEEMSEATPIEAFKNAYDVLEKEVRGLFRYDPPPFINTFMASFTSFKAHVYPFLTHSNRIIKQRILKASINHSSFEVCDSFREVFPKFVKYIRDFNDNILLVYHDCLIGLLDQLQANYNLYIRTCARDPQMRQAVLPFEEGLVTQLKEIRSRLDKILDEHIFYTADPMPLVEKIKTFCRFFEVDLQQRVCTCLPPNEVNVSPSLCGFHDAFISIVPILTSYPKFLEQLNFAVKAIDPLEKAMSRLSKVIGKTPEYDNDDGLLTHTLTGPIQVKELSIDPVDEAIEHLAATYKVEGATKAELVQNAEQKSQEMISNLTKQLEQVKNRLAIVEPLNSKDTVKERLLEIRKLRDEMDARAKRAHEDYCRRVAFQLKRIVQPNVESDNETQVSEAIASLEEMKVRHDQMKIAIESMEKEFDESRKLLKDFSSGSLITTVDSGEPLVELVQKALKKIKDDDHQLEHERAINADQISHVVERITGTKGDLDDLTKRVESFIGKVSGALGCESNLDSIEKKVVDDDERIQLKGILCYGITRLGKANEEELQGKSVEELRVMFDSAIDTLNFANDAAKTDETEF